MWKLRSFRTILFFVLCMKVVSLFDGISCAYVALQKASLPITSYLAYEIDPYAIEVSKSNHPSIVQKGCVKTLTTAIECDLLIGGSPCIDLSIAKQGRKGLKGDHSKLFYEYVRIKKVLNPKWFLLENVASMPSSERDIITKELGVQPICIDAGLVSAQRRKRLFWTNIAVEQPTDRKILLSSIVEPTVAECYFFADVPVRKSSLSTKNWAIGRMVGRRLKDGKRCDDDKTIPIKQIVELSTDQTKCGTLTKVQKDTVLVKEGRVRRLTPIECERLMGLPDDYTKAVSETQRYKCIGNAFHTEVIAHILGGVRSKSGGSGGLEG